MKWVAAPMSAMGRFLHVRFRVTNLAKPPFAARVGRGRLSTNSGLFAVDACTSAHAGPSHSRVFHRGNNSAPMAIRSLRSNAWLSSSAAEKRIGFALNGELADRGVPSNDLPMRSTSVRHS